jgi:RNA recognition motif-containing protein
MSTTQRLLVHNIPPNTTPDTVRRVFGKYGGLSDVHVPRGVNSRGQNFAFVEFEQQSDAAAAFDVLNNTTIDGYALSIYHSPINYQIRDSLSVHRAS